MIPIAFYGKSKSTSEPVTVLAADLGGTKVNFALYKVNGQHAETLLSAKYHSRDYPSFVNIIETFFSEHPDVQPQSICIGVAGPVINGSADITNLNWIISADEIAKAAGYQKVTLINDLEATAYGVACLPDEDLVILNEGDTSAKGNIAIIAPGTGLGEAGMFWDGNAYHPFATEGGHTDFGARTEEDIELYRYIKQKEKVVSREHVLSGPGIYRVYNFLKDVKKMEVPTWLNEAIKEEDPSAAISTAAIDAAAEICIETMKIFMQHLGHESANLVLKMKAIGGLYLAGGIPPKIIQLLQQDIYLKAYLNCDRMHELVQAVPIKVIMNEKAPLLGAGYYGANHL